MVGFNFCPISLGGTEAVFCERENFHQVAGDGRHHIHNRDRNIGVFKQHRQSYLIIDFCKV